MDKKIDDAISKFVNATSLQEQESAREVLKDMMAAYPKNNVGQDYWTMRHYAYQE